MSDGCWFHLRLPDEQLPAEPAGAAAASVAAKLALRTDVRIAFRLGPPYRPDAAFASRNPQVSEILQPLG